MADNSIKNVYTAVVLFKTEMQYLLSCGLNKYYILDLHV